MAATTIARDTLTNDDGSGTTGDIVNAANLAAWFYDNIDALFTASQQIEKSSSGAAVYHIVYNSSNTASSDAYVEAVVGGASAGDPMMFWAIEGVQGWTAGPDNSDRDAWMLCVSNLALAESSAAIKVATSKHVIFPELSANPSTDDLTADAAISLYTKADKLVFAYNNGGTMTYITLDLDGSDTSWTHSTSAP